MKKEELLQEKRLIVPKESRQRFHNTCKRGIYKELHKRGLITDVQLNYLLGRIE